MKSQRNGGSSSAGSMLGSAKTMFQNMFSSSSASRRDAAVSSTSSKQKTGENHGAGKQAVSEAAAECEPDIVPIHTDHAQTLMNQV